MTRNQPSIANEATSGVLFTVDSKGNITPDTQQAVSENDTIVIQAASGETFSGYVCAQQDDECMCSTLVDEVSSGNHMEIGTFTISSSAPADSEFDLYGVPDGGPVEGTTNGTIHVGG